MPILHVRNVPERIYNRLRQHAETQHRSLSAEVVTLLDKALTMEDSRLEQAKVLERMRRYRRSFRPSEAGAPDTLTLLREDRDR